MSQEQTAGQAIFTLIVGAVFFWYLYGGGFDKQVEVDVQNINNTVASDMVKQYTMVKGSGTEADICAAAMMVSAAYLQAKDEANYQSWEQQKRIDCHE